MKHRLVGGNESYKPDRVNLTIPHNILIVSPTTKINLRDECILKVVIHCSYFFHLQSCICCDPRMRHILLQGKNWHFHSHAML